jgi:hypothetical protein
VISAIVFPNAVYVGTISASQNVVIESTNEQIVPCTTGNNIIALASE